MKHHMKLKALPFEQIASGRKTIELRLFDSKRRELSIGDRIIFTNMNDPDQIITAAVKSLHRYASFEELFQNIPPAPTEIIDKMSKYHHHPFHSVSAD